MKAIASAVALGLLACAGSALAADGTITINGQVSASTCTITGTNGANVSVTLPTVSTSALNAVGQIGGTTPFKLTLSNCTGNSAQTRFELGSTVNQTTGNLYNATGAGYATNVEVQILNNASNAINLLNNTNSQIVNFASKGAVMQYYARYYATGVATAGNVATTVAYSMIYN